MPRYPGDTRSTAPKKRMGQHFLTSAFHARRIAEAVPAQADETVLEIGAGRGALSRYLIGRFPRLHCNEMDRDVVPLLREALGEGPWTLHNLDILDLEFATVGFPLHVVGNLPYNVGAPIIKKTLLHGSDILSATFMVQREVAERIVALPHTKRNGFLSIFVQFFGKPKILFHVPPGAFFPKPNVDSAVFQIVVRRDIETVLPRSLWMDFFAFVDKGFSKRRKTLANALGWDGNRPYYETILSKTGFSPSIRSEDLGIDEWRMVYLASRG